jgi:crotonobetainyl-CoA:carnitine CoA-transferase CaiB-like acyl-CoA transferase
LISTLSSSLSVLIALLQSHFSTRPTSDWLHRLGEGRDFPVAPINRISQVLDGGHAQVQHLQMVQTMQHPTAGEVKMVRSPVSFSETKTQFRLPPPLLGQHTQEVLSDRQWMGEDGAREMNSDRLEKLKQSGVIKY